MVVSSKVCCRDKCIPKGVYEPVAGIGRFVRGRKRAWRAGGRRQRQLASPPPWRGAGVPRGVSASIRGARCAWARSLGDGCRGRLLRWPLINITSSRDRARPRPRPHVTPMAVPREWTDAWTRTAAAEAHGARAVLPFALGNALGGGEVRVGATGVDSPRVLSGPSAPPCGRSHCPTDQP